MPFALRVLAALASGLILVVISPPINLHALLWLSFVPLLWALQPGDDKRNVLLGLLTGVAGVGATFGWIARTVEIFGEVPLILGVLATLVFALAWGLPYAIVFGLVQPLRRRLGLAWLAVVPALQVSVELLYPALFPYNLGAALYRTEWAWQLASVTGVWGLSYLLVLTNCAAAEVIYRRREGAPFPARPLAVVAALFIAVQAFGAWRFPRVEAQVAALPTVRLSQLQTEETMEARLKITNMDAMIGWMKLSSELVRQDIDLLVWPEGALLFNPTRARISRMLVNLTDRTVKAPILFGGRYEVQKRDPVTAEPYVDRRNSMYFVDRSGGLIDRYDKMVPLPFGEYVPLGDELPWLKDFFKHASDFRPGERPVVFELPMGEDKPPVRMSTPICYEVILGALVREQLSDVDLLVNVTNDGWFGDTAAPHQHAMLAAARSVELGLPMYRLAYTGVSMTVSPSGRISDETEPFTRVARVVEVPYGRIPTIYSRIGDTFAWACGIIALLALVLAGRREVPE